MCICSVICRMHGFVYACTRVSVVICMHVWICKSLIFIYAIIHITFLYGITWKYFFTQYMIVGLPSRFLSTTVDVFFKFLLKQCRYFSILAILFILLKYSISFFTSSKSIYRLSYCPTATYLGTDPDPAIFVNKKLFWFLSIFCLICLKAPFT